MSGSPGRDYSRWHMGPGSDRHYRDRDIDRYQPNNSSPISGNKKGHSPPEGSSNDRRRQDRRGGYIRRDSRDSRSPNGRRRLTREPSDSSGAPAPAPSMPAPGPAPAETRQTPKSNPLPPPPPMNSFNTEIAYEVQAEVGSAIAKTLSEILAQLSNDNINTIFWMSEKKTLEESQTDLKKVQPKQDGPYIGKYPVIEARQKRMNDETDKKHKSITAKLEECQVSMRKNCDQIASKIVPDILKGCTKMLLPREDTKSKEDFERLSKKYIALEAELQEQKKSLENVKNLTTNLVDASNSQMTNSESVIEEQKAELEVVRKQCSELGKRVVSNDSGLEGVRKQFSELGQRVAGAESTLQQTDHTLSSYPNFEEKVKEMELTLSKLQRRQDKVEEDAAQEKTKSEDAFNDFKNRVSKKISERKSATPQPNMQQTLDDAAKLSDRVNNLEASSKAHSAVVDVLRPLDSKDVSKIKTIQKLSNNVVTLLEEQGSDSNKLTTFEEQLKEVKDTATATAELLAIKSREIGEVQARVHSSTTGQPKALEKLKERISSLEKTPNLSRLNTESLDVKKLAAELEHLKKDIEPLKAQLKELREVQRSASSAAVQPPQGPVTGGFESAIEELNSSMEAQFEGLEESFGQEVNRLKDMCKEAKDDIVQLKEDMNTQTFGANLHALEGRVDVLGTQLKFMGTEHGQKLNSIDQSVEYLNNKSQANAHAVMNLDSRYNNITTVDIYKGMTDSFAQDMFPKVDQLYESVIRLQNRTQALESAGPGSNTSKQSETIEELQLRLVKFEATLQAHSSAIEKIRTDLKNVLDAYSELLTGKYPKLAGAVNRHSAGQNGDSAPSGVVNGSSKKRLHTNSPIPSQPNGQHKRARVAKSEEYQEELD